MPIITTKLLGYLSGGLGVLAALLLGLLVLQSNRLSAAQARVKAESTRAETYLASANNRAAQITEMNSIIATQTASIEAIQAQAAADRKTYVSGILHADTGAKAHESKAAELVKVPVKVPYDRCEAARALIEEEMLNVR